MHSERGDFNGSGKQFQINYRIAPTLIAWMVCLWMVLHLWALVGGAGIFVISRFWVLSSEFWALSSGFWVLGSGLPQQWTAAVYCNIYWKTQQRMQSTATDSVRGLLTFSITAQRECQFPPLIYIWIYIQDKYCTVVWGWCGSDNEC